MKNRTTQISMLAGALLAGVVTVASPASAAITNNTGVVSLMTNGGGAASNAGIVAAWGGNPILYGDLATNATITLLSGGYPYGGSVANLKDGLMLSSVDPVGGPYRLDTTDNSATFDNGASPSQIKLVLDGTYNLTRIDLFTSYFWARTGQKWDVFTSTDGGTNWSGTALASVNYLNEAIDTWQSRRVSVLGNAYSAAIASGVNALRFDIYDTSTNGGGADIAVFSEIALYSAATLIDTAVVSLMNGGGASSNASIAAAWGGNPILVGNLATNATITLLSGGYPYGGSVANLKDGLMVSGGGTLDNTDNSATFDNGASPSQVRLVLDGTYDLAKIDVFTSYTWQRTGQKWDVFTSTDGGTTWSGTALASVDYLNEAIDTWQSRRVSVLGDDAFAAFASGVNALRFDIYDTSTNGGGADISVFSEIAVYGAYTWTGGSGNWSATNNWLNRSGTNGGLVRLSGAGGASTNNALTNVMGLNFQSGAGSYTVSGSNALTVGSSGINNSSTNLQTVSSDLALGASASFTSASGAVAVAGNTALGTNKLTFAATAAMTHSGVISGSGSVAKTGAGTVTLSGNNTYDGSTTIVAGTLQISNIANGGVASGIGQSGNVATNLIIGGTLRYAGTNGTTDRLFSIGASGVATIDSGSGSLGFTNTGSLGYAATNLIRHDLNLIGSGSGTMSLALINDIQNDPLHLTKSGSGTWTLLGANTYSGETTISGGTLQVGNGGAAGTLGSANVINNGTLLFNRSDNTTVGNTISGAGAVSKDGAGTLTITANNTYTGGFLLTGNGAVRAQNAGAFGSGLVQQSSGSSKLIIDTTQTVTNAMSIYNIATLQTVTMAGAKTLNNATFDVAADSTYTESGQLTGGGGITKVGAGTLLLAGSVNNTYSGATVISNGAIVLSNSAGNAINSSSGITVNAGASLILGASNQIGDGVGLTLNGGTLLVGAQTLTENLGTLTLSSSSTIDFGGYGQTGSRQLTFASSTAISWTGTLTITNWQGVALTSSEFTDIVFGVGGLTTTQLAQIRFANQNINGGVILNGGDLVPVPEARIVWAALALALFIVWRERRRWLAFVAHARSQTEFSSGATFLSRREGVSHALYKNIETKNANPPMSLRGGM